MSLLKQINESVQLLNERRRYTGKPLEAGKTSIAGVEAPAVRDLYKKEFFPEGASILDYGAGKTGRNAIFLRDKGHKVYAYDPFNGTDDDGWVGVSSKKPKGKFDIGMTSFVLNVVPEHTEDDIITFVKKHSKKEVHITRNKDIFDMVKKNLAKKDKLTADFFLKFYAEEDEKVAYENGTLTDEQILDFCHHGVATSRGLQRIPLLEESGFELYRSTASYKVYTR